MISPDTRVEVLRHFLPALLAERWEVLALTAAGMVALGVAAVVAVNALCRVRGGDR